MAERPRDAILRGWVTLRLNFRLKGYVSRQYLWIFRWRNGYTTTLLLEVFTQRNFVADFIRLKLNFLNAFKPLFGGIKSNVRTPSIARWKARWKARGRLSIYHNWTLFAISYRWYVISGNLSKSAFFEEGWVTLSANFRQKGASPTNHCWCQKTRVTALSCGIKMSAVAVWLYHKARVWQTDRQTEWRLPTPR